MPQVQCVHTSLLAPLEFEAIWELLVASFPRGVTSDDFENALGGMHAMVWDGDQLVAHGSVVLRRMLHQGMSRRTGYVEGVAVASSHRRTGLGSAVMDELERVIRGGFQLGALSASSDGTLLYQGRDWRPWRGTTSVLSPDGIKATPEDDDSVQVLPVSVELDFDGELTCDWREGDVW